MPNTKQKLRNNEVALGGWVMIGHPSVAQIMAGEGFDWIGVDMEHTPIDIGVFHQIALAVTGSGCDLLARLHSCDPVLAKLVLDAGADGVIVPSINTPEEAALAVAMCKYPPEGFRGAALCRATDFGRNFGPYFSGHNDNVLVIIMLEHIEAVSNADAILATPGVDGVLIGPYDLSASMDVPGQLDHPDVRAAQQTILDACTRHGVPAGIHVAPIDPEELQSRIRQGFRFIACGIDTAFIMHGCREMLKGIRDTGGQRP